MNKYMPVSESKIQNYVVSHFRELGFLVKTEHTIQIGSRTGRADVVVYTPAFYGFSISQATRGKIEVIIECKAEGEVGHAKPQLNSYLCATDTLLGVFANSLYPAKWKYYENHGRNRIEEISRKRFLGLLTNERKEEKKVQDKIRLLSQVYVHKAAKKIVTETSIQERVELIIKDEAEKRVNEKDFRSLTEQILNAALNNSEKEVVSLKEQVSERNGCLGWSIFALCVLVIIFFLSHS